MKLWFFGSGAFGLPTLERLAAEHEVLGVVTQPDRPAGRGRKLKANPVAAWAEAHLAGRPIIKAERISREAPDTLTGSDAEAWVVIAFGQKLSQGLLADRFAINLHASLLPRWRGAAPINAAILHGDRVTGNSVIALAERMDAGQVYAQSERAIEPSHTAGELHDLLAEDGPELVLKVLEQRRFGTLDPRPQDESLATLAPKLSRETAVIDFSQGADVVAQTINGLSPWPGAAAAVSGMRMKLIRAVPESREVSYASPRAPGQIIDSVKGLVACGTGVVRLLEVTPAGKRTMRWEDFARGITVSLGDVLTPDAPTKDA